MVEQYEITNNEVKIAESFNTFFTDILSTLKILPFHVVDFMGGINPVTGDDSLTFILPKYENAKLSKTSQKSNVTTRTGS